MSCFIREIKTALRKLQALPWAEETVDLLLFMAEKAQEEGRNPANPRELML
ncbi:MAG: hypothetical protein ACLSG1_02955 [Anaerotignum faecicola]